MQAKVIYISNDRVLLYSVEPQYSLDARYVSVLDSIGDSSFLSGSFSAAASVGTEARYNIDRLLSLTQYLSKPLRENAVKILFSQFALMISDCASFGLPLKCVDFDLEHIFYDASSQSIKFVFLPFADLDSSPLRIKNFFKTLASSVIAEDETAQYMCAHLVNYLEEDEHFNPSLLGNLLLNLSTMNSFAKSVPQGGTTVLTTNLLDNMAGAVSGDVSHEVVDDGITGSVHPAHALHNTTVMNPYFKEPSADQMAQDSYSKSAPPPSYSQVNPESCLTKKSDSSFCLHHKKSGDVVFIHGDHFIVGKSKYSSYQVKHNSTVSRSHAIFGIEGDSCWVCDNNSLNGTYVNEQKIAPHVKVSLHSGDIVRLSNEIFVVVDNVAQGGRLSCT